MISTHFQPQGHHLPRISSPHLQKQLSLGHPSPESQPQTSINFLLPSLIIHGLHCITEFLGKVSTSSSGIHQPRNSSPNHPLSLSTNSPNLRQLIVGASYCPSNPTNPAGSQTCNRFCCKTCLIHYYPINSFTTVPTSPKP